MSAVFDRGDLTLRHGKGSQTENGENGGDVHDAGRREWRGSRVDGETDRVEMLWK